MNLILASTLLEIGLASLSSAKSIGESIVADKIKTSASEKDSEAELERIEKNFEEQIRIIEDEYTKDKVLAFGYEIIKNIREKKLQLYFFDGEELLKNYNKENSDYMIVYKENRIKEIFKKFAENLLNYSIRDEELCRRLISKKEDEIKKELDKLFDDLKNKKNMNKADYHDFHRSICFGLNKIKNNNSSYLFAQNDIISDYLFPLIHADNNEKITLCDYILKSIKENNKETILISGDGGIGKTVSCLTMAEYLLSKGIYSVYIPLTDVVSWKQSNPIFDYVDKWYLRNNNNEHIKPFFDSITRETNKIGLVVFLDGFNEIKQENQMDAFRHIKEFTQTNNGVKVILTSRVQLKELIDNPKNTKKIEIQSLEEQQIISYLEDQEVSLPGEDDEVWSLIHSPFMLSLFVKYKKGMAVCDEESNIPSKKIIKNTDIIWNYVISEIYSKNRDLDDNRKYTISFIYFYLIPYISYWAVTEETFEIDNKTYIKLIREACRMAKNCPQIEFINNFTNLFSESISQENDIIKTVDNELCVFQTVNKQKKFSHQNFRDFFAAIWYWIHADEPSDNSINLWNNNIDFYVEKNIINFFVSDSEQSTWNKLWLFSKYKKESNLNKLLLYYSRAYGNNISKVDFSEADLSEVSLAGYSFNRDEEGAFYNAKISEYTLGINSGHQGMICSLMYMNGELYSASHDCAIKKWNFDGRCWQGETIIESAFNPHNHYIRDMKNINENTFISTGDDKKVFFWNKDKEDKWCKSNIFEEDQWIYSAEYCQKHSTVVCGDNKGMISIVNVNTLDRVNNHIHKKAIGCLAYNKDRYVLSGGDDGLIALWDIENKKIVAKRSFGSEIIRSIKWINQKQAVIAQKSSFRIIEYDENQNKIAFRNKKDYNAVIDYLSIIQIKKEIYYVVYSETEICLFKLSDNKWELRDIYEIREKEIGKVSCDCVVDKYIYFGSRNSSIWRVEIKSSRGLDRLNIVELNKGYNKTIRCVEWLDKDTLFSGADDGSLRKWDVKNRRCEDVIGLFSDSVKTAAVKEDMLVAGSDDGTVSCWEFDEKTKRFLNSTEKDFNDYSPVNCTAFFDNHILTGFDNGNVKLDKEVIDNHKNKVYTIDVSPSREFVASSGNDLKINIIKISDERTELIGSFDSEHNEFVRDIKWTEDGIYSASNSFDGTILLHEFNKENKTLKTIKKFNNGQSDFIYSIDYCKEKKCLVAGSTDKTVSFLLVKTGKVYKYNHDNFVWDVSCFECNTEAGYVLKVASASSDGTIKVYTLKDSSADNLGDVEEESLILLPNINIIGGNFSKATLIGESSKLVEIIRQNGGIIENYNVLEE